MSSISQALDKIAQKEITETESSQIFYKTCDGFYRTHSFYRNSLRITSGMNFKRDHLNTLVDGFFLSDSVCIFGLLDEGLIIVPGATGVKLFYYLKATNEQDARKFVHRLHDMRNNQEKLFSSHHSKELEVALIKCRLIKKRYRLRGIWVPLGGFCEQF